MHSDKILDLLTAHKAELRKEFGVKEIGLFGSYARGENTGKSDFDILVELERPMGFLKFMRLECRLSEILGGRVDLVTKNALKPHIGRCILSEVIYA